MNAWWILVLWALLQETSTSTNAPAREPPTWRLMERSGRSARSAPVTLFVMFGRGEFFPGRVQPVVDGSDFSAQLDVVSTWEDGSIASGHFAWTMDVAARHLYEVRFREAPVVESAARVPDWSSFADQLDVDLMFVDSGNQVFSAELARKRDFEQAFASVNGADIAKISHLGAPRGEVVREIELGPRSLRTVSVGSDGLESTEEHPSLKAFVRTRWFASWPGAFVEVAVEHCTPVREPKTIDYRTLRIRAGGRVIAQLDGARHRPQTRWLASTWIGETPPSLDVQPDIAYLSSIGVVPPLDVRHPVGEDVARAELERLIGIPQRGNWDRETEEGNPLDPGVVYKNQPGTGDRRDIGWYPTWCLLALNGAAPPALQAARIGDLNGSAAFPIHWRDPSTGELGLRFDDPFWAADGARIVEHGDKDKNPLKPNVAHMPLLGFTTYLMSGRTAALEEFLCWTCHALRYQSPNNGILKSFGREGAWALRNLVLAARFTPDGHPLKGYFAKALAKNLAAFEAAAPNWTHPLGFFGEGSRGGNGRKWAPCTLFQSPWQMAWFFSMCCVGFKLHGDERILLPVRHHWRYWLGYLEDGQKWVAPSGESIVFSVDSMVEYSKVVSVYTPRVGADGDIEVSEVRPLASFAESCWYQRIQEDYSMGELRAEDLPEHGWAPEIWRPRLGRYTAPAWNAWHEYGPGRTALHWLAKDVGLPRAAEVARVLDPRVRQQLAERRQLPPGAAFVEIERR